MTLTESISGESFEFHSAIRPLADNVATTRFAVVDEAAKFTLDEFGRGRPAGHTDR